MNPPTPTSATAPETPRTTAAVAAPVPPPGAPRKAPPGGERREGTEVAPLILVVDDDDDARELTARLLRRSGFRCVEASGGDAALSFVDACPEPIDGMVLDVMMPGMNGFEVLRRLRLRPGGVGIPVVMVTAAATETTDVLHGFAGGAVDYVMKPYEPRVLAARVHASCERGRATRRLRAALCVAERQAATDPLTGLYNRRHLGSRLAEAIAHARRHGEPFALVLADVDRLKAVNDERGAEEGDRLLVRFATTLRESLRGEDAAFRVGGDEFVALLRSCDTDNAVRVAERIRVRLEATKARGESDVRFSAGIAGATADAEQASFEDMTPERLLARADAALYEAKRRGRDCIEIWSAEQRSGGTT